MCCAAAIFAGSSVTAKSRAPVVRNDCRVALTAATASMVAGRNLGQKRRTIGLPAMASERISTLAPSSAGSAQGGAMSPAESGGRDPMVSSFFTDNGTLLDVDEGTLERLRVFDAARTFRSGGFLPNCSPR